MAAIDLTGQVFGRLTVVGRAPIEKDRWITWWRCSCSCGKETIVDSAKLRSGHTKSCGCLGLTSRLSHGHTGRRAGKSPTYNSWTAMLSRCRWPDNIEYARYGGRGITVCERWLTFENFLADMGERPKGTTIDRKDNNGNYEPGNCRWATRREQYASRSTTVFTDDLVREIHGRSEHGESVKSISDRMKVPTPYIRRILRGERWAHIAAEG